MFEIKLKSERINAYQNLVYSWECPLCNFKTERDFSQSFVKLMVQDHLVWTHNAKSQSLEFVEDPDET